MFAATLTFAWALWRREGMWVVLILGYVLCAIAASAVLPAVCSQNAAVAVFVGVLLSLYMLFTILLCIFTYSIESADIQGRESCFPARLFRLPVSTASLVCWPMGAGAAILALLWIVFSGLILRPWLAVLDTVLPLWWPAFFAAASLAWIQALLWSPFGLPWLRVILFLLILVPALFGLAAFNALSDIPEALLVCVYASLTMAGWTVSYLGVRQARRGDGPNWLKLLIPLQSFAAWLRVRRPPFASADRAQVWFEWRLAGNSLPFMTGLTLPLALVLLFFGPNDVVHTERTLLAILGIQVLIAGVFGGRGGGNNPGLTHRGGLGDFSATLPMTTAGMVAAMLKVAALSTLKSWALVITIVPFAILLAGKQDDVADLWQRATEGQNWAKIVAALTVGVLFLGIWTWKRQADRLYFGLTGRPWVAITLASLFFPGLILFIGLAVWLYKRPDMHDTVLALLPWLLAPLLLGKLLIAGWALRLGLLLGLLDRPTVATWTACWTLIALVLFALLAWVIPLEIVPRYYLIFAVAFALPTARLAAAPLALAWNRHR